jgi:hypothetical protein
MAAPTSYKAGIDYRPQGVTGYAETWNPLGGPNLADPSKSYLGGSAEALDELAGQQYDQQNRSQEFAGALDRERGYVRGRDLPGGAKYAGVGQAKAQQQGLLGFQSARDDMVGSADALASFAADHPAGPSAAEQQLRQGANEQMLQTMALANSGRGAGGSAGAARDAMFANARTAGQVNAQAAELRAREEAARRGEDLSALGAASQAYGAVGDLDASRSAAENAAYQAELARRGQQVDMAQFDAELRQRAQEANDATNLGYLDAELGYEGIAQGYGNAGLDAYGMQLDSDTAYNQALLESNRQKREEDQARDSQFWGMVEGAGSLLALSDERAKDFHGYEDADLSAVGSHLYTYTDPTELGAAEGEQLSGTAQELERSSARRAVREVKGRKVVDIPRLVLVNTSATGKAQRDIKSLRARLEALEAAR